MSCSLGLCPLRLPYLQCLPYLPLLPIRAVPATPAFTHPTNNVYHIYHTQTLLTMLTILTIAYHTYHCLPRFPYLHHLLCFRRRTGGCGSSPSRLQCRSPSSFTWTRCRVTREACGAPGRQCSAIIGCGALAASRRIQQAHATAGLCHITAPPTQRLPIPSHATLHVLAAARACCCACLLLHVLAAARACCCACLLLHVLAAARACCCACVLACRWVCLLLGPHLARACCCT